MAGNLENNPFAALFSSIDQAKAFQNETSKLLKDNEEEKPESINEGKQMFVNVC